MNRYIGYAKLNNALLLCGVRSANPITDPARLLPAPAAGQVASEGGHIVSIVQPRGQYYWRVYSGDATMGRWLIAVEPRNAAWASEALSLPPGNTAQFIQRVFVPEGTVLQRSRALSVFGHRGGAEQFRLFEFLPPESYGPGVPLK